MQAVATGFACGVRILIQCVFITPVSLSAHDHRNANNFHTFNVLSRHMNVFANRLELRGVGALPSLTIVLPGQDDSDALSDVDPFDIF